MTFRVVVENGALAPTTSKTIVATARICSSFVTDQASNKVNLNKINLIKISITGITSKLKVLA